MSTGAKVGGAASGALTGATLGAAGGPIGIAAGALIGGTLGFFGAGGDEEEERFIPPLNLPYYELNELFNPSAQKIFDVSSGLVEGDVPEFLRPSIDFTSPQFEQQLDLTRGNVQRSVEEAAAATGTARGGFIPTATGQAVAQTETPARTEQFFRALSARERLFGTGLEGLESTRSGALAETGLRSGFELSRSELELADLKFRFGVSESDIAQQTEEDDILKEILKAGTQFGLSKLAKTGTTGGSP